MYWALVFLAVALAAAPFAATASAPAAVSIVTVFGLLALVTATGALLLRLR